jgi:ribonuclease HI
MEDIKDTKSIKIITDGSCLGNPGKGGWAALLQFYDKNVKKAEKMISGCSPKSTNNIMELTALLEGLKALKDNAKDIKMELILDSQYVLNGLEKWRESWEYRNFRGVKNSDLWKELYKQYDRFNKNKIKLTWVRGHNGHEENERVDKEAQSKARACK